MNVQLNLTRGYFTQTARDEATSALEHLHEAEAELQSLRIITHRMMLTKEEMVCSSSFIVLAFFLVLS